MKKTGIIIAASVLVLGTAAAAYNAQYKFPWNKRKAETKAREYIAEKYGLDSEVKSSSADWVLTEGGRYSVVFEDKNGVEFSVDVSTNIDNCWDNLPEKVFDKEMDSRCEDDIKSFWTPDVDVMTHLFTNYDREKYPDTAFSDGSYDQESFEDECEYYIVVFIPEGKDVYPYTESILKTLDYLKSNGYNADFLKVQCVEKDGKNIVAYSFDLEDEYPDTDSISAKMKASDDKRS